MSLTDKATRKTKFEASWPPIRDELLQNMKVNKMPLEAVEWYQKVCQFYALCDE